MSYKRLIPCIFILGGKAVKWFDDPTVVSEDVIALAKEYSDNGADELLVFDLSNTDQDHDESIELMKKINRVIRIPMVAGGNVKRQEDVKKILYTGAKRAMLNFSKPDSQKLIEEVAKRFGKEKIAVSLNDFDALFKQQHLIQTKKRTAVAMILESGEPREIHHFATLLGYGACAINPYLAQDTIEQLVDDHLLDKDYYAAIDDYNSAVLHGIVKIASKMGISTIQSYQGSKIFEAIGIDKSVIDKYFTDTVSRIGGITISDIENDVNELHSMAFDPLGLQTELTLDSKGHHKMRSGAQKHLYNPQTIHLLQESTKRGDYNLFKEYTKLVNNETDIMNIRGTLDFKYPKSGIPIDEVESVDSIVTRFKTGAMSYGSISQEAHETLAIAMNRLHGKSNSGEGGESLERLGQLFRQKPHS